MPSYFSSSPENPPQWGAADAEIKSHLVRTQSLNVLPLKPGEGQYIAIHVTLTARCKPPAYHSLEGFQHFGIFQLFEVNLESCVPWLADSFQAEVEGHHGQIVVTSL